MLVTTAEATEPIDKVRATLLQVTDQFSLTGPSSWNKCYSAWFTWSYNFEKSKPDKSDQEFNKRLSTKLSKNKCLIQPKAVWNFHLQTIARRLWGQDDRRSFQSVNRHLRKRSKSLPDPRETLPSAIGCPGLECNLATSFGRSYRLNLAGGPCCDRAGGTLEKIAPQTV